MTAPTQGKERGAASAARGPFPPVSSPFPRSLQGAARSARPRAARSAERGPLLSFFGARRPLPTLGEVGTSPCPDRALPAGSTPCGPGSGVAAAVARENPKPPGRGGGKEEDGAFPGATAPFLGRAGVRGPLSARPPVCALPRTRVPPQGAGHWPGCSEAPGSIPGAEGGRDPARQGSRSGKTRSG